MSYLLIYFKRYILFVIVLVCCSVMLACSQVIHHGLTEEQANEILVVLERNGIQATKVAEEAEEGLAFNINVPQRDAAQAWQILRDNDLPKTAQRGFSEVFGKTSLIPTATEEKALYLQAVMGELSKTIETINGVVDARVHVVLPESDVLKRELEGPTLPKAAVLIKYKADPNRSEQGGKPFKDDDIRRLVANSIEGLKPADVSVVSSEVSPDKSPSLVYFGPLKMSEDSIRYFQIILTLGVVLFLIVGIMLIKTAFSSISLKKEVAELRASASSRGQLAKTSQK